MLTVILTGGASRRMGRDKALLPYGGKTLLQTLIDRYQTLGPVGVSVNCCGRFPMEGARELPDVWPDQGPMNGVLSAFRLTDAPEILLTAVDLPNGDIDLARRLCELRGSADVCLVERGVRGIEPLFAIYGSACLPAAEDCMRQGRRSLRALLERVIVRYVRPEELPDFDLEHVFYNVNTPEDYRLLK